MERHCTAHLKRGVTLRKEILNCLKGKGCSDRRDGAWRQIKPCWEYCPCQPCPTSQGSSSINVDSQTEESHIHPQKAADIQCKWEHGRTWCFPHQLSKFPTEPLLHFYIFFNHRLSEGSLKVVELFNVFYFPQDCLLSVWRVSVILGNLKSSGRAVELFMRTPWGGRLPPSPQQEAGSSAIVSGSEWKGKSLCPLEPGQGIRSWNYRERHSWSITGGGRGALAMFEAPSSPVQPRLR